MKFELYCASSCVNEDTTTQMSGCAITLVAISDNGNKIIKKFEYGLGSSSKFRADLLCVRLALASIKPSYRHNRTILYVDNRCIQSVFDTASIDEYCKEHSSMMKWFDYYHNISVEISNNEMMLNTKLMAETAMRTQKHMEY